LDHRPRLQTRCSLHSLVVAPSLAESFGYVVLEGPAFLVDWGTRDLGRANSPRALLHVAALVDHYFSAYREAAALLEQRTHELAQVRRLLQAKPIRANR